MLCPVCKTVNLAMTDRQGIEIDYCPDCRGVWLDRGELDRLIERAEQQPATASVRGPEPPRYEQPYRSGHGSHDHYRHGKKRKSLVGELFDF